MRSFDLTPQIERLAASGIGRIQRIGDDVYRNLWPKTVDLPAGCAGRFDRALCVDVFPLYPMSTARDGRGGRRETLPFRLLPLPGADKPSALAFERFDWPDLEPLPSPQGDLLRYIVFWQAGERWPHASPNSAHVRFDPDERGLLLNEALHLPLQEEAMTRSRDLPIASAPDPHGLIPFLHWDGRAASPAIETRFGMFVVPGGVPSCFKEVVPVSTEHMDFYLK